MADGRAQIDPVRTFLGAPRCAVLSTIGADGAPRQIVIHYLLGDDHLRINGHRDLPRVSFRIAPLPLMPD